MQSTISYCDLIPGLMQCLHNNNIIMQLVEILKLKNSTFYITIVTYTCPVLHLLPSPTTQSQFNVACISTPLQPEGHQKLHYHQAAAVHANQISQAPP